MKANRRVLLISIFARCITTLAIQAGAEGSEIHNPWLPASPAGDAYLENWPDLVIRLQDMVFQSSFRMPLANGGIGSPDTPYVCQFFDGGERVLVAWGNEAEPLLLQTTRYGADQKPPSLRVIQPDGTSTEISFSLKPLSEGDPKPRHRIWFAKVPLRGEPCVIRNIPRSIRNVPNSLLHNRTFMIFINKTVPLNSKLRTDPFYMTVWESWEEYRKYETLLREDILAGNVSPEHAFFLLTGFDQSRVLIGQETCMWRTGIFASLWLHTYGGLNLTNPREDVVVYLDGEEVVEDSDFFGDEPSFENQNGELVTRKVYGTPPPLTTAHIRDVMQEAEKVLKQNTATTPQANYLFDRASRHLKYAEREIDRDHLMSAFSFAVDALVTTRSAIIYEKAFPENGSSGKGLQGGESLGTD